MNDRLQNFDAGTGKVENLSSPGREIQDALNQSFAEHAHDFPDRCGMMDGGCGIVAEALVSALPSSTLAGWWKDGALQHVMCRTGELYADADGLSTAEDVRVRMAFETGAGQGYLFPVTRRDMQRAGIPMRPDLSTVIADELLDRVAIAVGLDAFEAQMRETCECPELSVNRSLTAPEVPAFFLSPLSLD